MADFHLSRERLSGLPVHPSIDPIIHDVLAGRVTITSASTGSGKTMLLPGALADASEDLVVVLVPRRYLALDAAFNVAELSDTKIGDRVGYALGQLGGESSQRSEQTKLLYCTNGYAIHSGLINKAQTFVLDEVHEADEYISLVRAILRERKKADPSIRILEMSATVDAEAQARYWRDISDTAVYAIEGKALDCTLIHEPPLLPAHSKEQSNEDIVLGLLERGRKGIVVFRPGIREVENTAEEIGRLAKAKGWNDVESAGIHSGTPADERKSARRAPPRGKRKTLTGTNVIESGVNLRWLDAGVSDGYRKVPHYREDTGAEALIREDIPQAGLLQQMGRVNRDPKATGFEQGLFILRAKKSFEERRFQNSPAIQRERLNGVAFQAACLGHNPTQLTWDITSTIHIAALPARFEQAKQELRRLQLINEDWSLTSEGEFIKHLPVSPETGAMLCEAKKLDEQRMRDGKKDPRVLRDMVIIAAVAESHGLREDTRAGHKSDQYRTSDLLDAMNAFRTLRKEPVAQSVIDATEAHLETANEEQLELIKGQRTELKALCLKYNVSLNGFIEVARIADEITVRLNKNNRGLRFDARSEDDKYDAERYGELQRCILNAHANRIFIQENGGLRDLLRDYGKQRNDAGQPFNGYALGRDSIVTPPKDGTLMVGKLWEVPQEMKGSQLPSIVLTEATTIPLDVFISWAAARADDHQPILADVSLEGDTLAASYDGKASFEFKLTSVMRSKAAQLIGNAPIRDRKDKKASRKKDFS